MKKIILFSLLIIFGCSKDEDFQLTFDYLVGTTWESRLIEIEFNSETKELKKCDDIPFSMSNDVKFMYLNFSNENEILITLPCEQIQFTGTWILSKNELILISGSSRNGRILYVDKSVMVVQFYDITYDPIYYFYKK